MQIYEIDKDRNIIDSNKLSTPNNFCQNLESSCFIQTRVEDYDGNGILDIFNNLVDQFYLHRWEWSESKFIKVSQ